MCAAAAAKGGQRIGDRVVYIHTLCVVYMSLVWRRRLEDEAQPSVLLHLPRPTIMDEVFSSSSSTSSFFVERQEDDALTFKRPKITPSVQVKVRSMHNTLSSPTKNILNNKVKLKGKGGDGSLHLCASLVVVAHCAFFSHAKRRENEATKGRGHGMSQPKERTAQDYIVNHQFTSNSHIPFSLSPHRLLVATIWTLSRGPVDPSSAVVRNYIRSSSSIFLLPKRSQLISTLAKKT